MIWFHPEKEGGFNLGTPDWSGSSTKVTEDVPISNVIIGLPLSGQKPAPAPQKPVPDPEPEPAPPPPPEPRVDPRVENSLKLLAASISGLAAKKKEMEERDLHFCIEMAFAIAEQLVCGALSADKTKVLDIIKESLGMFDESDAPVVRLHPDILEALEEYEMAEEITNLENVSIVSDPSVSSMGCVVTANKKSVDGQVLRRLERLKILFAEEQGGDSR